MARALAATAAALAALSLLVVTGVLTGIDEWGIDHVMPALDPYAEDKGIVQTAGLWRPFPFHIAWWKKALDLYNYPASVLPMLVILAVALVTLVRRGERRPALIWLVAWCAVNAVELAGKHELERPGLDWSNGPRPVHVEPYNSSFPSGHTARSVVLAAIVAYTWPRLRWPAAVWLLFVPVALVLSAAHVITDVVGGMLLGLLFVLLAHAMIDGWGWTRLRASWSSSSATR